MSKIKYTVGQLMERLAALDPSLPIVCAHSELEGRVDYHLSPMQTQLMIDDDTFETYAWVEIYYKKEGVPCLFQRMYKAEEVAYKDVWGLAPLNAEEILSWTITKFFAIRTK